MIELLQKAFSAETWAVVTPAILATLYMTLASALLMTVFGILLGMLLVVIRPDGLHPMRALNTVLGGIINALRSLPAVVIIILTLPVARLLLGRSYGSEATILALAFSLIPMFARFVESSFLEVPRGKIEAAKSIGAKNRDIIFKVIFPESLPSLIRSLTIATIAALSATALAGFFGAGGLGDVVIRFGYQRFRTDMLIAAVLCLIVIVEIIQQGGDFAAKYISKKRHL